MHIYIYIYIYIYMQNLFNKRKFQNCLYLALHFLLYYFFIYVT